MSDLAGQPFQIGIKRAVRNDARADPVGNADIEKIPQRTAAPVQAFCECGSVHIVIGDHSGAEALLKRGRDRKISNSKEISGV